jgi:hypothetical protein
MVSHKLVRQGKGENLWGECSCGQWAWLGTYEMPKGRLAKLRAAHGEHVAYVASVCETCTYALTDGACGNPACPANPSLSDASREHIARRAAEHAIEEAERSERMRLYRSSFGGGS